MGNSVVNLALSLEKVDCPSCSATYAINETYIDARRKDGKSWACPYCQSGTSFRGDDENSRLKKQLADEQERKDRALAEANTLRAEVLATKTEAAKLKRRAANGVCPCCTRTFANVAQHIREKHPEMVPKKSKAKGEYVKQRLAEIQGGGK